MNYGRFFRLNQYTSKIGVGVAIYDYIDLPAYFNSATSNTMSPRYPISVTITEDNVQFRVHFNAFRVCPINEKDYVYFYDIDSASKKNDCFELKHMEEIILELPYKNDSTNKLYNNIREIYSTRFPFFLKDADRCSYITQLVRNRYETDSNKTDLNKGQEYVLYKRMRKHIDAGHSYSTLWLMGLSKEVHHARQIDVYDKKNEIVGFLRKLVLDFMFDLQHSKVFQTSKYYQTMYSGLMANFYFSALMHKCDYYYYRELINDIVTNMSNLSEKSAQIANKHLCQLYADNLSRSETLWLQDIMSSNAEKFFNDVDLDDKEWQKCSVLKIIYKVWNSLFNDNDNIFRVWNSWFADPEEEMRRVWFIMKKVGNNEKEHICVETLVEYLKSGKYAERNSNSKQMGQNRRIVENLTLSNNKNRILVSQWFLTRFAFNDVLKFHHFKYHLQAYISILLPLLIVMFLCFPELVSTEFWNGIWTKCVISGLGCILFGYVVYLILSDIYNNRMVNKSLLEVKRRIEKRRGIYAYMTLLIGTFIILSLQTLPEDCKEIEKQFFNTSQVFLCFGLFLLAVALFRKYHSLILLHKISHCLSNIHIFFPRLIASVTAAWLSLAIGNELFITFFDSVFSWTSIILLTVIVFVFVCYKTNKIMPQKSFWTKLQRSFQFVIISCVISFVVGLFVVNFTGERMLERSGHMRNFYSTYVNQKVDHRDYWLKRDINTKIDTMDYNIVSDLQHIKIIPKNSKEMNNHRTIASVWDGIMHFFILRDFLIQFAFVAMFIGVFIQMIFDEKQVTEM